MVANPRPICLSPLNKGHGTRAESSLTGEAEVPRKTVGAG